MKKYLRNQMVVLMFATKWLHNDREKRRIPGNSRPNKANDYPEACTRAA